MKLAASFRSKKTHSAAEGFRLSSPTVEQRLNKAQRLAILAMATANTDEPETIGMDDQELMSAIVEALLIVNDELYWLTLLPANILNAPAPDGDQKDELARLTAGPRAAEGGAR